MNHNRLPKNNNFWLGFFLGGLVGGAVIFIFGTKEGKKILDKLEKKKDEVKNKIRHQSGEFVSEAENIEQKIIHGLNKGKERIEKDITGRIDRSLDNLIEVQQQGIQITKEAKNKFFKKNGRTLSS